MKKKLIRFQENETFHNLFQLSYHELIHEGFFLKGKWHQEYFHNENPIILELGCGKGEYTTGLALQNPDKNYIGMDIKGARLWRGCKTAIEKQLDNVAFIRSKVNFIEHFFEENETDEIWIPFPDPQPQKSRVRKRLTHPDFLERYRRIVKTGGIVHLKTDDHDLYRYTREIVEEQKLEVICSSKDVYIDRCDREVISIRTFYEEKFLENGKKINYLKYRLT
ncbi:MAG: tRNA (guanosine(46)-N7)-methyltransferase TrmB [Bacteroidales bacterium]|nr:tRNA (guanosine(46)-N7)-methyltransferase TrmB [Bacteroidales bacterium]MCF8349717.1 tRNA (guanosine(46)-N7)-methyltransferase TrmB [Bacteroidales bacterium]MCF8376682.1 tRNA (guanosine(46)-N7)-methyltransferase TrmB [Bacteroidales bacterium]MCF8401765.1 tRNA (guanosine(46)-N7)-methyltransferase TrmB [Bacteroidales bacterium]